MKSRAAFKLLEAQMKYKFIKKGDIVADLGAAPGGWCQAALRLTGTSDSKPLIYAMDVLKMEHVAS